MGYFEIKNVKDQFHFVLKAGNHEIILSSELYKQKASALNGIESVRKNAADADRFEITEVSGGRYRFELKAGNHETIGTSEVYESLAGCENGVQSVMKNAPDAEVKDKTE